MMEYKNELAHRGKECEDGCTKECEVYAGICVPVELSPKAKVGDITVTCCGDPIVETENVGGTYKIIITQQVVVKIPIKFSVKTDVCKDDKYDKYDKDDKYDRNDKYDKDDKYDRDDKKDRKY